MISRQQAGTHQYPYYLFRWTSYGNFTQYIFIILDGEKTDYVDRISVVLNIRGYTKGHRIDNRILMLSLPKTKTFVPVGFEK